MKSGCRDCPERTFDSAWMGPPRVCLPDQGSEWPALTWLRSLSLDVLMPSVSSESRPSFCRVAASVRDLMCGLGSQRANRSKFWDAPHSWFLPPAAVTTLHAELLGSLVSFLGHPTEKQVFSLCVPFRVLESNVLSTQAWLPDSHSHVEAFPAG